VYVLLFNSFVNFLAKICTHCGNIKKSQGVTFYVYLVWPSGPIDLLSQSLRALFLSPGLASWALCSVHCAARSSSFPGITLSTGSHLPHPASFGSQQPQQQQQQVVERVCPQKQVAISGVRVGRRYRVNIHLNNPTSRLSWVASFFFVD